MSEFMSSNLFSVISGVTMVGSLSVELHACSRTHAVHRACHRLTCASLHVYPDETPGISDLLSIVEDVVFHYLSPGRRAGQRRFYPSPSFSLPCKLQPKVPFSAQHGTTFNINLPMTRQSIRIITSLLSTCTQ